LRERFHVKELVGMGLAALGAITVVFSSSQNNPRVRAPSRVMDDING
jgi:hypothetical protein